MVMIPPLKPQIVEFLGPEDFTVTRQQLQSKKSDMCADHCISYLIKRSQGFSTEQYLNYFGDKKCENDKIVRVFVKSLITGA